MAQLASVSALGAEGRRFESGHPDQKNVFMKPIKKIAKKVYSFLKTDLGFVILIFLVWRLVILFLGVSSFCFFHNLDEPTVEFNYGTLWNIWARWDGWHYIRNSLQGYALNQPYTAFFPLYPLLIAGLSFLLGINPVASGLLLSNLSVIGLGYFLIKLVRLDFPQEIARRSFIFLLAFPTAIFLGAVYTESLFLFFTIAAFYFARQQRWVYVFPFALAASLTRNLGVLLVVPLLMEYFWQYRYKLKIVLASVFAPAMGLLSYMIYLWIKFGDPLRFVRDQAAWNKEVEPNILATYIGSIRNLFAFGAHRNAMAFIEVSLVTLFLVLIGAALYRKMIRKSYVVWMILLLLPPMCQNIWSSTNRYVLVVFPAYILLALFANKYKAWGDLLLVIFATLLGIHTALFVNYMWAG